MPESTKTPDVAELQAHIEGTREDLSRTVDLLAAKLDVKARLGGQIRQTRDDVQSRLRAVGDRAREEAARADTRQVSIGAGVLAALVAVVVVALWQRNQSSRRQSWHS